MDKNLNAITSVIIERSIHIHRIFGPGVLESVYERVLAYELTRLGLRVVRQLPVDITYDDMLLEAAFRIDLLVEDTIILEIKSQSPSSNAHRKQLLTYLRLKNLPLGLLINFGYGTLKEGIQRVSNNYVE